MISRFRQILLASECSNKFLFSKRNIDLKQFAICQGYKTENQLAYFKKCSDHHKAWDSICNIYRQAIAMELVWPYAKSHSSPSVKGYLAWVIGKGSNRFTLPSKIRTGSIKCFLENMFIYH